MLSCEPKFEDSKKSKARFSENIEVGSVFGSPVNHEVEEIMLHQVKLHYYKQKGIILYMSQGKG